jgi:hypothetical protein
MQSESLAPTNTTTDLAPGLIPPNHLIQFPQGPSVTSLVFSPDGSTLYATVQSSLLNIGAVLDATAHYWFTPLAAIVLLIAFLRIRRILHTPQVAGQPHCARCNYNLAGHRSGPCPECGVDPTQRKPRPGRTTRRRLAPWLATSIPLVVAAIVLWIWIPRWSVGAFSRLDIMSESLGPLADKHLQGRLRWRVTRGLTHIMQIDPRTGAWTRLHFHRAERLDLTLSADGRHYYRVRFDAKPYRLEFARLDSGEVVSSIPVGEVPFHGNFIAGHSDDGSEVYFTTGDANNRTSTLIAWNPITGRQRTVATTPSFSDPQLPRGLLRPFLRVPGRSPAVFVNFPNPSEVFRTNQRIMHFFAEDGRPLSTIDLSAFPIADESPVFTHDGNHMYMPQRIGRGATGIHRFTVDDLLAGTVNPSVLPIGQIASDEVAVSPDDRFLLVDAFYGIFLRDTPAKRWYATLVVPEPYYGVKFTPSPDNTTVAGFAQDRPDPTQNRHVHPLLIWTIPQSPPPGYDGQQPNPPRQRISK